MKKPVVDYRSFRLSRIREPQYSHMLLLLGWIFYFAFYFITENLIPDSRCHVIHCVLDDWIPFNEYFALIYCYWYVLLVFSLAWFFFYDTQSFRRLQTYIIVTQVIGMAVYIIYPSIQLLRPEVFPRDNFLSHVMAFIYSFDTPTGVCPSLHVAYSGGIASAWCRRKETSPLIKVFMIVSAVLISLSTAFVKQHSVVDIFAAIPLCLLAESFVRWTERRKQKASKI